MFQLTLLDAFFFFTVAPNVAPRNIRARTTTIDVVSEECSVLAVAGAACIA